MKDTETMPPVLIERAKGLKLYDQKGRCYYDTISSWWCNIHGHSHPRIKEAIRKQLAAVDHILFAGFTHKSAINLAEKLIASTPAKLTKVFFSDNGSTAVETALKISFQYWHNIGKRKKTKFVALDYSYHGDTIGTMSISGVSLFNEIFTPLFFTSFKIPSPYCYRCTENRHKSSCNIECIRPLETLLQKRNNEIAGVILEPLVMAAGGMIIYPVEYLIRVAELTQRYNVHLILDEVATGFGRTGKMFACEYARVQPEFICLSKGITSGTLPLGATLTTEKIYHAFYADYEKKKTFYHGHTYTANPIACSVALASLRIFTEENMLQKVKKLIPFFHYELERFRTLPIVGDVRYIGMIGALELVCEKGTKKPFSFKERIGVKIYQQGLKRGLLLRPLGNIIYFYLPLCIKKKEILYVTRNTWEIIHSFSNALKNKF
jgi:adenosylmethionine-8-amino-7-oxononanoate aminotransferase